jgi:RNA polymerase sigma-70 factor (ECF subfamily)
MRAADGVHRAAAAAARAGGRSADRAGQAEDPRRGHPAARARSGRAAGPPGVGAARHLPHVHRGTLAARTSAVVRDDLCEEALRLAAGLHRLLPDEPEAAGLLALILLTSARAAARADEAGALVLLAEQDRSRWDRGRLDEGRSLVEAALAQRRPGPYQLQAAIAACHADAAAPADTDWRQIAALYSELLRFDPSPVIEANRAIAVAYAEGPAAGLAILDTLAASSRLARWPQLHIARAALLAQCGRHEDAVAAYRDALALEPADAIRRHITGQIAALGAGSAPTEET